MDFFVSAVSAMKEGKKVRRKCWNAGQYMYASDENIFWNNGSIPKFNLKQFEAIDWEVIEDKKTLSERRWLEYDKGICHYNEEDVKEAIKEFIGWLINGDVFDNIREGEYNTKVKNDCINKAKEIFGERLV